MGSIWGKVGTSGKCPAIEMLLENSGSKSLEFKRISNINHPESNPKIDQSFKSEF